MLLRLAPSGLLRDPGGRPRRLRFVATLALDFNAAKESLLDVATDLLLLSI